MGLNIKNEHVHELARAAALRTGRSQTSAIELALQTLLERLDRDEGEAPRMDLIHGMQSAAADFDLDTGFLHDEAGLPR